MKDRRTDFHAVQYNIIHWRFMNHKKQHSSYFVLSSTLELLSKITPIFVATSSPTHLQVFIPKSLLKVQLHLYTLLLQAGHSRFHSISSCWFFATSSLELRLTTGVGPLLQCNCTPLYNYDQFCRIILSYRGFYGHCLKFSKISFKNQALKGLF